MTITNYTNLQSTVADFLNRSDLTSAIPVFIQLAETQMNRDIRHWRQQRRVSSTANERYEDLPVDFLEAVQFYIDTANGEKTLEFASMAEISRRELKTAGSSGEPEIYTLNSAQIKFFPAPDTAYDFSMIYYAKTPALSDLNTTNWIITHHPDAYLYGTLLHSAPYLAEDSRIAIWAQMYAAAVKNINDESESSIYSGSRLVLRNR